MTKTKNNNISDAWDFKNEEEKTKFINRIISNNLDMYFFLRNKLEFDNRFNSDFDINKLSNWDIWYSNSFSGFTKKELDNYPKYPY